jgi:nitrite reductase (NO-forming)
MADIQQSVPSGYSKRPLWQWILLYLVIGALIYGAIYYFVIAKKGGYNTQGTNNSMYPTTQPTITATPTSTTSSALQVTVTGTEFSFTPSSIAAKVGQTVQLTFKNAGQYPHNLTITQLGVKTKTIQPGQEDTITFTADKAGTFTFLCTVPGHADRGMTGTFTVK